MATTSSMLKKLAQAWLMPANPDDLNEIDKDLIEEIVPTIDKFLGGYYRLEVDGLHNAPAGKSVLVINHNSGISAVELIAFGARWYLERGYDDVMHGLAHDGLMVIPYLNNFLVRAGGVRAAHHHADRILGEERKVLVAPGGNLEAFRPFKDRHRINFAGRKGFIRLAVRNQAPLVPTVFIGGHETMCILHDGQFIVKALGLKKRFRIDTFPIFLALPWGLAMGPMFHLPLPSKCKVRMLDPIPVSDYAPEDSNDPRVLQELYDLITARMQTALNEMAAERKYPVLG